MSEFDVPEAISPANNADNVPVKGKLLWNDKDKYSSYHCQIADNIDFINNIYDDGSLKTTEFEYELLHSNTYYWRVKIETSYNFSSWTNPAKFSTSPETDVYEDYFKNKYIDLYPNPASEYIEIHPFEGWQPSEGYDIQIFDLLGTIVASIHPLTTGLRMNIENLAPGLYFVKIGNKLVKFVKI